MSDPMSDAPERWQDAVQTIKDMVCGEKHPRWSSDFATTTSRFGIADLCDYLLGNAPNDYRFVRSDLATAKPTTGDDAATVGDMAAFGASHYACYKYPGEAQQAERAAFCEGAAFSAASPIARTDERDLTQCEHCSKEFDITQMTMMEDCWFCEKCVAEFRAAFDACDHDWSPHTSVMGEPGKICSKCTGFVCDDAIAAARTEEKG